MGEMLESRSIEVDVIDRLDLRYVKNYVRYFDDKIIVVEGKNGQRRYLNVIPRIIEFNKFTSYNLGLWIGDRWGGKSRVGLKNKDIALISSFKSFLLHTLYQEDINEVIIRRSGEVIIDAQINDALQAKMNLRVIEDPSMFGNWVYGVYVQNGTLRTKVMDKLISELPEILQRSSEQIVAVFVGGVMDAEAYMDYNKKRVAITVSLKKKTGSFEVNLYSWCLKRLYIPHFIIKDRISQVIKVPYKGVRRLIELVEPHMKSLHKKNMLLSWT